MLELIIAVILSSIPIMLAATGELVVERSGVLNLGVVALLAPGLVVWHKYVTVPDDAFKIEVVAYQWGWNYRLPDRKSVV